MRQVSICLAALILVSSPLYAYETRLDIDRNVDLDALARSGQVQVNSEHDGATYYIDASAILNADFSKLEAASSDYDHYVQMGMPNLKESHVVARSGDILDTWSYMSTAGQSSKHYLEVQLLHNLNSQGAAGSEWELVNRQAGWPYPEDSSFSRFDGSWYMEPLSNGKIYVRYFIAAEFDVGLPDWLISFVAKRELASGVSNVIQVLARQASNRQ